MPVGPGLDKLLIVFGWHGRESGKWGRVCGHGREFESLDKVRQVRAAHTGRLPGLFDAEHKGDGE